MFTVVAIVFLLLSFCASVFGMNATEFSADARLPLVAELRVMLPVSAGVILVSFALAFSRGVLSNGAAVLARPQRGQLRVEHGGDLDRRQNGAVPARARDGRPGEPAPGPRGDGDVRHEDGGAQEG
ncbi:hypothetical protein MYCTH_2308281, partial [Thermothelomyces thermophilus ATCC 42464]